MVAAKLIALVLVVLTVIPAVAHALEWPGKKRLPRQQYFAVQPIYYPGFTWIGAAEPLSIVALAVLLALSPGGTRTFWLIAGALAAAVLTHLIYWVRTAPVNRIWLKNEKLSAGAQRFFGASRQSSKEDWTALRSRWERSHLYRAATSMIAFLSLAVALTASG